MMTVKEVSKLTGVSIRTLQYYDKIGLFHPTEYTRSGYRMYDDTSMERLQQILLFKKLQFSSKEIKAILDSSDFDRNRVLEQQITLLTMKRAEWVALLPFGGESFRILDKEKLFLGIYKILLFQCRKNLRNVSVHPYNYTLMTWHCLYGKKYIYSA